jgi:hypothetical protein
LPTRERGAKTRGTELGKEDARKEDGEVPAIAELRRVHAKPQSRRESEGAGAQEGLSAGAGRTANDAKGAIDGLLDSARLRVAEAVAWFQEQLGKSGGTMRAVKELSAIIFCENRARFGVWEMGFRGLHVAPLCPNPNNTAGQASSDTRRACEHASYV